MKKKEAFDIEKAFKQTKRQLDYVIRNQDKILRELEIIKENSQGANKCSNMVVDYIEYKEGANPIYKGKCLNLNGITTGYGLEDED